MKEKLVLRIKKGEYPFYNVSIHRGKVGWRTKLFESESSDVDYAIELVLGKYQKDKETREKFFSQQYRVGEFDISNITNINDIIQTTK